MLFQNNVGMLKLPDIIQIYINEFNASPERKMMITGEEYYKANNDINHRKMIRYENEMPVLDETKPNHRLSHAFMHTLVDDKVNYLMVKPYTLECEDENYLKNVQQVLGKRFQKKLSQLGTAASNKGITWLHPYINDAGDMKFKIVPSEQLIPWWIDNDHEELQAVIWYYVVEIYEGTEKKYQVKVEYWEPNKVEYYTIIDAYDDYGKPMKKVVLDSEKYLMQTENGDYSEIEEVGHFTVNGQPGYWNKVPFVPFKNNDMELPDLQFVKSLIDDYDITRSDISNLLTEIKDIIYALRGYEGESLSEFAHNMAYYHAVKIDNDGGIDKIEHTINIDAAEKHFQQLKKDITDFGQGVDKDSDTIGNSPSGIALKFLYSGLDLKCNALEENFKWSFEELLYFVNMYMQMKNIPISDKEIDIIFNRDIAINESQTITDCQNSKGIISDRTIIANHPYVKDLDEELKQIEEESKSSEEEMIQQNANDMSDLNGGDNTGQ
jgi:SPP1 family phage portal protein